MRIYGLSRLFSFIWSWTGKPYQENIILWKKTFWEAWETIPFDQKLGWILLISNTIGVLTLIEFLVFSATN